MCRGLSPRAQAPELAPTLKKLSKQMPTQLKQATTHETTLTLSGAHVGDDVPVRVSYETGQREDEYGDDVRDRRLHTVEVEEDVGFVELDGERRALWAGDELPVFLFEQYEADIDKAIDEG